MTSRYHLSFPKGLLFELKRAALLDGAGSLNNFLLQQARQLKIKNEQRLTKVEETIIVAIQHGYCEAEAIAKELGEKHAKDTNLWLASMVDRGILIEVDKGGKTNGARGKKTKLYLLPGQRTGDVFTSQESHSYAVEDD